MRALGIILAGGTNKRLGSLVNTRTNSAMPIASAYRAVDFAISNMANSGISKIAVVTQYNSRSLAEHLNSSKWWNIGRKNAGIHVFTPYASNANQPWYRGTADSIFQNLSFLEKSHEKYVVIANGDGIYKLDFKEILKYHKEKDADITIAVKSFNENEIDFKSYGNVILDNENKVSDFEEKPLEKLSDFVSTGIYIIKRELLIDLIKTVVSEGRFDFVNDIIVRYRRQLNMYGFKINSYWKPLNSLDAYFQISRDFLDSIFRHEMLHSYPYIMTKNIDAPPAKYNYGASIKNSLIGNGAIINGYVEDTTLFRDVRINSNSSIVNCIIFEGTEISENCALEYVIIDRDIKIEKDQIIKGTRENPIVISRHSDGTLKIESCKNL